MTTWYSRCLVNENTVVESMSPMVDGFFFLANTTGKSSKKPIMMAGAMPLASMVSILLMSVLAYRRIISTAICFIRFGSIW